ncbi:LysR family transcriptional regulator [Saccharospirillum sp. MSK14-1]|uniref:LysR family transcriptional regulator n=1 Tax=Saccharospirillum sp. MSK14-1 TaxID=1897632 RepID=UPI000D34F1BD|nr:LysR family transcriptional regulator [Saccharospirillum sp. MSK14-1]PTY37078.1 LysR family transcriptional regulator [Saccharospirillum sp. MSK14-1]
MDWSAINFDWNRARAFLVTAEEGSFSAGARALGVAQPTLGRQVAALEEELGVTLFERLGQGLALTDAGRQLQQHVKLMAEAASRLSISATGHKTQLEGRVTIAVSEIEAVYLLPPVIGDIRRRWPGIELNVQVSHTVADLKRREADVALRSFRPTEPDLIARKLYEEAVWLYGTPDYLSTLRRPERRQDVQDVQIIGFEPDHQMIDYLAPQGWAIGADNMRLTTLSQLLQLELVKQHLGLCFLPKRIGDAIPGLQRAYEHLGAPLQLPLWLVSHRELRTNPRVRVVFDALAHRLVSEPGQDDGD